MDAQEIEIINAELEQTAQLKEVRFIFFYACDSTNVNVMRVEDQRPGN